jgi:hypothetical protein
MSKTVTLGYTEIKHPFAFLSNGLDSTTVWFAVEPDKIVAWDDIPVNWPRWSLSIHTRKEALRRIIEMATEEGWDLISTTEKELEQLVLQE